MLTVDCRMTVAYMSVDIITVCYDCPFVMTVRLYDCLLYNSVVPYVLWIVIPDIYF